MRLDPIKKQSGTALIYHIRLVQGRLWTRLPERWEQAACLGAWAVLNCGSCMGIINVRTKQIPGGPRMETTPAEGDQSQVCLSRGWGLAKRTTGVWVGWVPCNVYSLAVDRATCENTAFGGTWAHVPVVQTSSRSVRFRRQKARKPVCSVYVFLNLVYNCMSYIFFKTSL